MGSLDNAAAVISQIHRGEKRLVFVDSRRGVEQLARALRGREITTFVSHGSLGRDERLRAELAFAEASDCVIVATSTLELGIDVGDLDRVIQIDAPPSVSSFLQRIGRTGRRPGTSRNCLFLATSQSALQQAAALALLWSRNYVEPVTPPALPLQLLAQQLLALTLQESASGLPRQRWTDWLGAEPALGREVLAYAGELVDHLIETGWLFSDGVLLSPGDEAESRYGVRNFMELTSSFVTEPLYSVRFGRTELGLDPRTPSRPPSRLREVRQRFFSAAERGVFLTLIGDANGSTSSRMKPKPQSSSAARSVHSATSTAKRWQK